MKALFKITGFLPYILIVFLNAMTDLGHKIILQNTIFKAYEGSELIVLTAIVNALILLPFIFLFSPSGFIADKYPKTKVIKYASGAAIVITILILVSYMMGWFWIAFLLTFVLAAQSAIYSPAKYGLIKEMTGNDKLAQANAWVQSVTIVSILLGAVIYSYFFEQLLQDRTINPHEILTTIAPVGYLLIGASVVEFLLANKLVATVTLKPKKEIVFETEQYTNLAYMKSNLSMIKNNQTVWLSIIGLSVLWGVSQVVVAVFGEYLKSKLGITDTVIAQGLLSLAGLGMIVGSMLAGRVSRNYIETGIIPLGALGVAVTLYMIPSLENLWMLGIVLFLFGVASGLFMVPLNAMIQFATPVKNLGKVLAGNNFMQNISMFGFLFLTACFAYFNMDAKGLLYFVALVAFVGMGYTLLKLPQSLVRYMVRMIIAFKYDLQVEGLSHIKAGKKGILLLGNHISFLDWAILQMAYPKQIRFVMERSYYEKWYLKPFLDFFKVIPISSRGSKTALSEVTKALNAGDTVALFPEGHLSRNGHLGAFQRGFEVAAKEVEDAVIVPFYLRGLWEDDFSYASKKMKRSGSKDISVHFGEILPIHSSANNVKKAVFDLSIKSWKTYAEKLPVLQKAWIESAKQNGNRLSMADSTGVEVSGDKFITGTLMIAGAIKKRVKKSQNVGVLLPTSVGGSMGNMALLSLGKTVVNLNYSSGNESLGHAFKIANITTVLASSQFITKLKAKGFDLSEVLESVEVIYLEEVRQKMRKVKSLLMFACVKILPATLLSALFVKGANSEDTAAILFSSGSEGTPKGIELSHKNMMGNIKQATTLINPHDEDVMLGTLPIFHSFGLTVTTLLPLIEGIPVVCHPDPTDGFGIGKMAAKYEATMLFATATFFRLYTRNKKLHPLMFKDLRMVIAGAEKLPLEIRDEFKKKFGHDIYEGYGATETTPVASINIPDVLMQDSWKVQTGQKVGTVGLPVPGSSFKIVDPESFEVLATGDEGMILIGGTQIMKGYIGEPDKTASVIKEIDGIRWYVTGDKGRIDEDGFLTIVDRYSRFAKVGGEMVSLGLVEGEISKILGESDQVAVVALPDAKKGERLVLLLEGDLEIDTLKEKIRSLEMNPLFVPSEYFKVDELPKLGTGKADFKGAKKLAEELSDANS